MKKNNLLIIEDELSVAKQLKWGLGDEYDISLAAEPIIARPLLSSGAFPVATLDLGLPPHPDSPEVGLEFLQEIASLSSRTKVIVITGNAEKENAVKAIGLGAVDFCSKPIDLNLLRIILSRTFTLHELEDANLRLRGQVDRGGSLCGMVGTSPAVSILFDLIRQASATDYPVLVTGDSGTGKEMAARAVHMLSPRAKKPLVIINCGAIPENLLESELFGHEKGAFTGAVARKIGRLEEADEGTVFLDEIGELSLPLQVKILRFLQEGTIERVGGTKTRTVDARIVAASNIDLKKAVEEKRFREDLFYRLNVVPIRVPSLKERTEDILVLAHYFLGEETKSLGRGHVFFSSAAISGMMSYSWPGNVRELQNRIRRALGTNSGRVIDPIDLGLEEVQIRSIDKILPTLKQARDAAEIKAIRQAMALSGNNISQAARLLETSRPTLHDLLKKHNMNL